MNESDSIIAPDRPKRSGAERSKLPLTKRPQPPAPQPSEEERPGLSRRRHRKTTALNLTFGVVGLFWLAVMWAIVEMMLLEIN